jgi:hypothetical protein
MPAYDARAIKRCCEKEAADPWRRAAAYFLFDPRRAVGISDKSDDTGITVKRLEVGGIPDS